MQERAGQGALLVKGNHDEMAVRPPAEVKTVGDRPAGWTHAQLDSSQLAFLDSLPLVLEHGSMALVHASLDRPELWRYVTDQRAAAASLDAVLSPDIRHVFGGPCAPANPVLPGFGHLIEAAACGCPLVIGSHTFNFAEAAELAQAEGAAQRVVDMCEGVQVALELVRDPPALAQAGASGLAFAARHRGAMDRTLV